MSELVIRPGVARMGAAGRADARPVTREGPTAAHAAAPRALKLIELARQIAEAGPPVDYARIAQIRQAIAQGGYALDPQAIADILLDIEIW